MKIESKYSIGDTVYLAEAAYETVWIPCPDCLGIRAWWVWMPSGEEIAITCPTCKYGYESRGTVEEHQCFGRVRQLTIDSVRIETYAKPERMVCYMCEETGVGSGTNWHEPQLYATCNEAKAVLPELVRQRQISLEEMEARRFTLRRSDRPGSMAAYYRKEIRSAKKDIAAAERGLKREAAGMAGREEGA